MSSSDWEIIHIPPKPPFSPTQQSTVNVFASVIDPQIANTLIRKLNQLAPLEDFRHVKRVRKICSEGKIELLVVLCLTGENDSELGSMPKDVLDLTNSYQLSPFVTQVCKYAATTKEEWTEQCKLWPTSFHPPIYNIEGISGFNDVDSKVILNYMNFALKLAKSGGSELVNAAVIVDPSDNQIIATARDEISSWIIGRDDNCIHSLHPAGPSTADGTANGSASPTSNVNGWCEDPKTSHMDVCCLNPWGWSQQHQQSSSSCLWHPLRHAAMVAIEHSATRDRHLFPTMEQIDEKSIDIEQTERSLVGSPAKRQRTLPTNGKEAAADDILSKADKPYLCTGCDIFLAWEPCPMCAMALVHQRIRRIFFAFPNPRTGALGSVYRLQGEKSLNHHYAVFRVVLHSEAIKSIESEL